MGTGFLGHRCVQRHGGDASQGRVGATGDCDNRNPEALQRADQPEQILRIPAFAEHNRDIILPHYAQIPMQRIDGMKIGRRRARGCQRGRDFSGHEAGLSNTGHNDSPAGGGE
jgi:hypothetical protein